MTAWWHWRWQTQTDDLLLSWICVCFTGAYTSCSCAVIDALLMMHNQIFARVLTQCTQRKWQSTHSKCRLRLIIQFFWWKIIGSSSSSSHSNKQCKSLRNVSLLLLFRRTQWQWESSYPNETNLDRRQRQSKRYELKGVAPQNVRMDICTIRKRDFESIWKFRVAIIKYCTQQQQQQQKNSSSINFMYTLEILYRSNRRVVGRALGLSIFQIHIIILLSKMLNYARICVSYDWIKLFL